MQSLQKKILRYVKSQSAHPLKMKELAKNMKIGQEDYRSFRAAVNQLVDTGELVKLKRGRIGSADQLDVLVGKLSVNRHGTGFIEHEGETDLLIPGNYLHTAFDGDKVMARLIGLQRGRQAGQIVKVLERSGKLIVGVLHNDRGTIHVKPDNPRYHRNIIIPPNESDSAKDGEKVVCRLTLWDDPNMNPLGSIVERLGMSTDSGVDMLGLMRAYDLREEFPRSIVVAAKKAASIDTSAEEAKRLDLTGECIYTIDPFDAKDHDDAISVSETSAGFKLGVHIADVSYFVKADSELDSEAFERGNSVYLPGVVLPMLPEVLSNEICSLKPNVRRLAHSVLIEYDKEGKVLGSSVRDTVIRSQAKLSYEEAQEFFDTGKAIGKIRNVADNLLVARKLARLLQKRRSAEGSLDFDLPESKLVLDDEGMVIEISNRERLESHRLVEEFMLAANRETALILFRAGQSLLYRVHDRPDQEKLEAFSNVVKKLGYRFAVSPTIKPIQFARFLKRIKDAPESAFINELLLRSMQKAVYQRKNLGHFGLAFSHYTHFTSPIRRYPDLLIHRLLRKLKNGKYPASFAKKVNGIIDHVGKHCSETERTAEGAEREAVKLKQVVYMARHLGDEFAGVISGTTGFGFFVRLDNLGVEGLVRISSIDDDYYHFDEPNFRLVGRRLGRVFRMGDHIRVVVKDVDLEKKEIQLEIVKSEPKRNEASRKKKKGLKKKPVRRGKKK